MAFVVEQCCRCCDIVATSAQASSSLSLLLLLLLLLLVLLLLLLMLLLLLVLLVVLLLLLHVKLNRGFFFFDCVSNPLVPILLGLLLVSAPSVVVFLQEMSLGTSCWLFG